MVGRAATQPANALQIQISYLRKTLGSAEPTASSLLETRAGGYSLAVEPAAIGANRFESAVRGLTPLAALRARPSW